jgi:hypothetical protein
MLSLVLPVYIKDAGREAVKYQVRDFHRSQSLVSLCMLRIWDIIPQECSGEGDPSDTCIRTTQGAH